MNVHIVRIGHLCISDAEIIMHTIHVDVCMSTVYLDYVCDVYAMHSITSSILYCVCILLVSSTYTRMRARARFYHFISCTHTLHTHGAAMCAAAAGVIIIAYVYNNICNNYY